MGYPDERDTMDGGERVAEGVRHTRVRERYADGANDTQTARTIRGRRAGYWRT